MKRIIFTLLNLLILEAQISEEEFKKSFKRPDEALLKQVKQSLIIPSLTEDFVKAYADNIQYEINSETIRAWGGATILYKDTVIQADRLIYNRNSGELIVEDGVRIFKGVNVIEAENVKYNVFSGSGEFKNGQAFLLDSFFSFKALKGAFDNTGSMNLEKAEFSSCRCTDGEMPWSFEASECRIKKGDSLSAKGVKLNFLRTPVLYIPYFELPLEESRKSGFLTPKFGYSRRHGVFAETPVFIPPSYNSDLIITPFLYERTRVGVRAKGSYLMPDSGFISGAIFYSNESPRFKNGEYEERGLDTQLFRNTQIDKNRLAGSVSSYSKLIWEPKSYVLDFVIDAKRASDDLLIKETKNDIARHSAPFLLSSAYLRLRTTSFGGFIFGASSVQDFGRFKDKIFDEAPTFTHTISKHLGSLKLGNLGTVASSLGHTLNLTNYLRDEGYEGSRFTLNPIFKVTAPISNLINVSSIASSGFKFYSVDEANENFQDRLATHRLETTFSTRLERIFSNTDVNLLDTQTLKLKHYIEPFFGHILQDNSKDLNLIPNFNPLIDRQRDISALKYGVKTYLNQWSHSGIYIDKDFPEILPNIYDYLGEVESLRELSSEDLFKTSDFRKSSLALFEVAELYSLDEEFESTSSKFSSTTIKARINPLDNLSIRARSAYDRVNGNFNFARFGSKAVFGDTVAYLDYVFKNKNESLVQDTSEIIGGIKFGLFDRVSIGSWLRYDLESSKLLDSYSVIQLTGKCGCWFLDFGLEKKENPDDVKVSVSVVLSGIGDIVQEIPFQFNKKQD